MQFGLLAFIFAKAYSFSGTEQIAFSLIRFYNRHEYTPIRNPGRYYLALYPFGDVPGNFLFHPADRPDPFPFHFGHGVRSDLVWCDHGEGHGNRSDYTADRDECIHAGWSDRYASGHHFPWNRSVCYSRSDPCHPIGRLSTDIPVSAPNDVLIP